MTSKISASLSASASAPSRTLAQPRAQRLLSRLPQLSLAHCAQRNRALTSPPHLLPGQRLLLWQDNLHVHPVGELHCKLGSSSLWLAADNLSALEPRLLGLESFVASESCTSLVEHALAPLLDLIERLAGHALSCEAFERLPATRPSAHHSLAHHIAQHTQLDQLRVGFTLLSPNPVPEVRGWLRAPLTLWRTLDFSRGPSAPIKRYTSLPLSLVVRLGQCRLPLAELRALQPGDALRITPTVPRRHEGLPVRLLHPSGLFGCRARLHGDQLTLETLMSTSLPTQPTPPSSGASKPAAGTNAHKPAGPLSEADFLSSIECDLSFELGSLQMSLADIGKLRVGQALPLGIHLNEQPVRILTSGREIARGELAAVGEEIVVVLTQTHGLPTL